VGMVPGVVCGRASNGMARRRAHEGEGWVCGTMVIIAGALETLLQAPVRTCQPSSATSNGLRQRATMPMQDAMVVPAGRVDPNEMEKNEMEKNEMKKRKKKIEK